jgi:outer membrane protein TolC
MKIVKNLCVILSLVSFEISACAQNSNLLTFEEALQISLKNNHSLKQVQAVVDEKSQIAKSQKGLYLPKVGISANYVQLSNDINLDLNPVKNAITPLYSTLGNYGNFSDMPTGNPLMPYLPDDMATEAVRKQLLEGLDELEASNWNQTIQEKQFGVVDANFQWVLYAGGKVRAANKVSQLQQNESEFLLQQKSGELTCNLVQQYYGLCLAQEATLVRKEVLDGMNKHVSDAQKMVNEGVISDAELLKAKMFQAEAQREYNKAVHTENVINAALISTLADDNFTQIQTVSTLFILDSIQPLNYYLQLANQKNPMLAQVKLKYEQSYQGYKVEQANYLPTIAAMGTYDIVNKDLSPMVPDWMVGVGLNWTIFDGTTRYHKMQSAKLKTVQVDEYYQDANANISVMIEKTYNELQINIEQIKDLEASQKFANEYVRVQEKAFHEDMANSTDLIDARLNLEKVKMEKLRTMYEFDVNLAILLHYTGIIEEYSKYKQN